MTRDEFLDDMQDIGDLLNFCGRNDCDVLDHVVDEYSKDDYINEMLVDQARNSDWRDMYSWLRNVYDNSGYDYYEYDDYEGEYRQADYDYCLERVLDWCDEEEFWDEPDEEDEEFIPQLTDEELYELEPVEEEDCSVMDMFAESNDHVRRVTEEELEILGNSMRSIQELINE